MNDQFTPLPVRRNLYAAVFLLTLATPIFSQQPPAPTGPPPDRTNTERARQQDMSRREYQLRTFGTQPSRISDRKQLEALMQQTEQDFNRILTLHNQIVRATSSDQALDYHFVSKAAAEIKKRASRLQTTLALRESETGQNKDEKWDDFEKASLEDVLRMLCKRIKSFVTNPVIETPGTVHAEHLEKARHDLAGIVKLSGQIKKDADKLSKTGQ